MWRYSWACPLAVPGSFFTHLKCQRNREINRNENNPYQKQTKQPTNKKANQNPKHIWHLFGVQCAVRCAPPPGCSRKRWECPAVQNSSDRTTHFSISSVFDHLSKLLHCSLSPFWALPVLLISQKQQNSSSVLITYFYPCYRTQNHPIAVLPNRYLKSKGCSHCRQCPSMTGKIPGLW